MKLVRVAARPGSMSDHITYGLMITYLVLGPAVVWYTSRSRLCGLSILFYKQISNNTVHIQNTLQRTELLVTAADPKIYEDGDISYKPF